MERRTDILAKIYELILSWPDELEEESEAARIVDGEGGRQADKVTPSIPSPILPDNGAEGDSEQQSEEPRKNGSSTTLFQYNEMGRENVAD